MKNSLLFPFLCLTILFQSCFGYETLVESKLKPNSTVLRKPHIKKKDTKMAVFENDIRPEVPYELVSRIIVTGNVYSNKKRLLNKMKKEAAYYGADAILLTGNRYVWRDSYNGVVEALNVVSTVSSIISFSEAIYLEPYNEYDALELEGIAIKYKE
ncbi:MAG: hypothetical protein AB8F74_16660 [Saprospiraceae bacterium]